MKKLIFIPLFVSCLLAQEKKDSIDDFLDSTSKYRNSFHESIKKGVRSIDSFIVDDINKELNYDKNYLLIENSTSFIEGEESKNELKLKLKLYLPKLKEISEILDEQPALTEQIDAFK